MAVIFFYFCIRKIMDLPLKISAVSYLNTFPFVYGILKSGYLENFSLELDVPSVCAEKLKNKEVDIALVPVGAMPDFDRQVVISDYCIGAVGKVRSVLLLSEKPLQEIQDIYLDQHSRTSVRLARVLAEKYWNISPHWRSLNTDQPIRREKIDTLVAIGDKTFDLSNHYKYIYDLAEEWLRFTGLPFVFAVWMSKKELPAVVIEQLNKALAFGLKHKAESLIFFRDKLPPCLDCLAYLENNISFQFDEEKKKGMQLFLDLIK